MRVAVQADSFASLKRTTDSTLLLIAAARKRDHEVFYYTPDTLSVALDSNVISARGAWLTDAGQLGPEQTVNLSAMQVILVRQDPPFDLAYLTTTYLLEMLPASVRVINPPAIIRNIPEKLAIAAFPDAVPPTLISRDSKAIRAFFAKHGDIVLKPLYGHGGQSVFHIKSALKLEMVLTYLFSKYDHPLVAQVFLPAISEGDTRLTFLAGELIATLRRVPAPGEIRSNLGAGATVQPLELDSAYKPLIEKLSRWLRTQQIMLAGIDLVGDKLMEINVTSPTLLPAIKEFYGIDVAELFWGKVEKRT
jgi:glutathione synthase